MHQKRTYFPVFLLLGLSALLLCFALLAPQWASSHSQWVEEVYSQILYPAMGLLSARFLGIFPFSVGEFLLYGLIGCGLALLVWLIVLLCRKKWRRALGLLSCAFLLASALFAQFYVCWGLNYYRLPLSDSLGLDVKARIVEELSGLCRHLANLAGDLRADLPEDESGVVVMPKAGDILQSIPSYYNQLAQGLSFFSAPLARPKAVLASEGLSYLGITGIYLPFTHESNVNVHEPPFFIPVTAAHECAHQLGLAREDECNFAAYLACMASGDAASQYSGVLLALIHCGNALAGKDSAAYTALVESYSPAIARDLARYHAYWRAHEGKAKEIANAANDNYLKAHGQDDGVASYGRMVDLMLAAFEDSRFSSFF